MVLSEATLKVTLDTVTLIDVQS